MTQKITQMKLARYLFTAVLALLFVSCSKGRSSNEPKPNNGEQTTSSKQAEEEIVLGQREVTLQVGETSKVALRGAKNARVETSNSNLVEAALIEQETALSLKGLQAGEGTVRVFSSNRYAELRVVVKANEANPNNSSNGKDIVGDKVSPDNYELSVDGLTLIKWKNTSTQNLDMNRDSQLRKITSIGDDAFSDCRNLKNVHIANSVTRIGEGAFRECRGLENIHIPNSVTSIEGSAFSDCSSLTSVNIPSSITSIEKRTFYGCSSLTSVNIPSSVTSIEEHAFFSCLNLTSINIPSSVRSIGQSTFGYCSSLTSISIPSSVTSIGDNIFQGCSSLTSVNIPSSITSIGSSTFYECRRLTSVSIPSSVTKIGYDVFEGCNRLTSVVFKGNNPPTLAGSASGVFKDTPSRLKLTVPKGAKNAYIKAGYPEDKLIEQ